MKVNTNSWHYRFAVWLHHDPSPNLCTYFWQVVGPILIATIFTIFIPIAVYALIMKLGWWIFVVVPAVVIIACLAALIMCGIIDVTFKFCEQRGWIRQRTEPKPQKEPNIFFEYLKAKKEKICPLIEFKDLS